MCTLWWVQGNQHPKKLSKNSMHLGNITNFVQSYPKFKMASGWGRVEAGVKIMVWPLSTHIEVTSYQNSSQQKHVLRIYGPKRCGKDFADEPCTKYMRYILRLTFTVTRLQIEFRTTDIKKIVGTHEQEVTIDFDFQNIFRCWTNFSDLGFSWKLDSRG